MLRNAFDALRNQEKKLQARIENCNQTLILTVAKLNLGLDFFVF
jgi:hypothetical protein